MINDTMIWHIRIFIYPVYLFSQVRTDKLFSFDLITNQIEIEHLKYKFNLKKYDLIYLVSNILFTSLTIRNSGFQSIWSLISILDLILLLTRIFIEYKFLSNYKIMVDPYNEIEN